LNENTTIDKHLIRKLANTADVCEALLAVHQQQYGSWKSLIEGNEHWFKNSLNSLEGNSDNPAALNSMRDALGRLRNSGKEISDDLVVKNDKLIERVIQLFKVLTCFDC
jgi:hypothetical protein